MFIYPVSITADQLDPDYQHVHHTTVLCLMEKARTAFMESAGFPQSSLFARDLWAVISHVQIEYIRELKVGEYAATCDEILFERRRTTFDQRILDSESREIAQAKIQIMWFSKEKGRAITPPYDVIGSVQKLWNRYKG